MNKSTLRFVELGNQLRYKNWEFRIGVDSCGYCDHHGRNWLQVVWKGPCTETGETCNHQGRKWMLSEHMTDSEFVLTALKAVLTAEEHEAREQFTFKGKKLFHPHPSLDLLLGIAQCESRRME